MACGLTAGRRGAQKPGISKYPQLRWVRSDGWIFRAVIRQSRRLRICGGSEVVTKFSRRRRKVVTPEEYNWLQENKLFFAIGIHSSGVKSGDPQRSAFS